MKAFALCQIQVLTAQMTGSYRVTQRKTTVTMQLSTKDISQPNPLQKQKANILSLPLFLIN